MGFNPGLLCALAGLGKFGLLIRKVAFQGLAFLHSVLELLLDLTDPGLMFFAGGLFFRRFLLGLGQRVLEGLHLSRSSYEIP